MLLGEIEILHRSALMTVDNEESVRLTNKIEASSMLAYTESISVRKLLKLMDEETRALPLSESDVRLRSSKHRSLCKKFMSLMERFESIQATYKQKYENQVERQYRLVKPEATEEELAQLRSSPMLMSQQVRN